MTCATCSLVRLVEIADSCSLCRRDFILHRPPKRNDSPSLDPRAHLYWEIAAAFNLGRPLGTYEAAPGCPCVRCTGIIPESPGFSKASYDDTKLNNARSRSFLEVLELVGASPHKKGGRWVGYCVLHNDTNPSLSLDMKKGLWYCFVCQEGGDGIQLWMAAKGHSFQQAIEALS